MEASRNDCQAWKASQDSQENAQAQQAQPSSLYGSMLSRLAGASETLDWMLDDPKKGTRLEQKLADAEAHLTESQQARAWVAAAGDWWREWWWR